LPTGTGNPRISLSRYPVANCLVFIGAGFNACTATSLRFSTSLEATPEYTYFTTSKRRTFMMRPFIAELEF